MITRLLSWTCCFAALTLCRAACGGEDGLPLRPIPADIQQVLDKPMYRNAVWGLRVVDRDTGELIHDLNSGREFVTGSVRKVFSVGLALDALGPNHLFRTPVYRQGTVDGAGVLTGDLILVASGDLSMGGRTLPDGSYAITDLDHNEADSLGSAQLTTPDPLAGYRALANQVAAAGITRVTGEVIIDDRLWEPFDFRGQFKVTPIFVNDDVVDVLIRPGPVGQAADVQWRPLSAAFSVQSTLTTARAGTNFQLQLAPQPPDCIGSSGCAGHVSGQLPMDFVPPLTGRFPLVQTFRITQPSRYARTVLIEALQRAGVSVAANAVGPNSVAALPASASHAADARVAELVSAPFKDAVRHILKVSYNIGADTSLMLFGLTKGARRLADALAAEREVLIHSYGIPGDAFHFIDGSGGGSSSATGPAVLRLLDGLMKRAAFPDFFAALPRLGVDGSLSFVTDFEADPSLRGAKGKVVAKTGTTAEPTQTGASLKAQTYAGFIDARSGRRLVYFLAVNDVGEISSLAEILAVFQDQGTISAMLWRDL